MIGKKIKNPRNTASKTTRITGLIAYITNPDAKHELADAASFDKHKCTYIGLRNFLNTTVKTATAEMIALASESIRSADPIVHYMLSWKKDEHPTQEQIDKSVKILMKELGFSRMQCVYGLHQDTDNDHLHIAVNRIDPDTGKACLANKGFDIECLHKAVARIELEQGWEPEANARYKIIDNGELVNMHPRSQVTKEPTAAVRDIEVFTGEKSVLRLAIENAAPILKDATSWHDLHQRMELAGCRFEKFGNGAKIFIGDVGVKASDVSRQFGGLTKLEKRLGQYQPGSYTNVRTIAPEPLKAAENIPGSGDYYKARRLFYEAKKAIRLNLNQQDEAEQNALVVKYATVRNVAVLQHKWQGKGELRNAMEALVAAQKKAEFNALARQQKLRAMQQLGEYKSFPPIESWLRENVSGDAAEEYRLKDSKPVAVASIGSTQEPLAYLKRDILAFTYAESDAGFAFYRQGSKWAAFTDTGNNIAIHDQGKDVLLAAMQLASEKWPRGIELTGSDDFKLKCVDIAIKNSIVIANLELQDLIAAKRRALAKEDEERRARIRAKLLEKSNFVEVTDNKPIQPEPVQRDQWGNVVRRESPLVRNNDGRSSNLSM